ENTRCVRTLHVLCGEAIKSKRGVKVRRFAVLLLAETALGLLIPTRVQSFTYGTLIGGQTRSALAFGSGLSWRLVYKGNTEFQISQSNTKAVISFFEVTYFDGVIYYNLNGQTILTFSSPTDGIIKFKQTPTYPGPVHTPAFSNFSQTYNATTDQLTVT